MLQLPKVGKEKPLTTDQACWYFNERSFLFKKLEYGNLILNEASTRKVNDRVESVNGKFKGERVNKLEKKPRLYLLP